MSNETYDANDAWGVVAQASECGDHPCDVQFKKEDIQTVFYYETHCCCGPGHCGSYCDSDSTAAFRLSDGRYVLAQEGSDSSGHG